MQSSTVAANAGAEQKLKQKLTSLTLRCPQEAGVAAIVAGKRYVFPDNDRKLEAIAYLPEGPDGCVTLVAKIDGTEQRIDCGKGTWQKGRIAWRTFPEQPVAASGAWTDENTFTTKLCLYETPFVITVRLTYSGDELRWNSESNVGFGPTMEPELVGKAE
jgi:hypothetical protein